MKRKLLFIVFIINVLVTSAYIILKYVGNIYVSRVELSLLLIYDIITFIIFGELLYDEDKKLDKKE
jgi:hypothetical protein